MDQKSRYQAMQHKLNSFFIKTTTLKTFNTYPVHDFEVQLDSTLDSSLPGQIQTHN